MSPKKFRGATKLKYFGQLSAGPCVATSDAHPVDDKVGNVFSLCIPLMVTNFGVIYADSWLRRNIYIAERSTYLG